MISFFTICFLLIASISTPFASRADKRANVPIEETSTPNPAPKKVAKIKNTKTNKTKKRIPQPHHVTLPPPDLMGPPPPSDDAAEILYPDEIGEKVSHIVVGLANRLDSFFGEERSDDERNGSTLRLVPSYTFYDKSKGVYEMGVNLNLKLKNLESKAKHLEKSIREEILETAGQSPTDGPTKTAAQIEAESWHYNFESKLAARPAIYYSGKFRVRRNFEGDIFVHHFSLSGGWDTDDFWTQKTGFQSDHALTDFVLFRFINEANWFITKKSFQTTHGPSFIQTINRYNSISYNFRLLFGSLKNEFEHLESAYSVNFRHGTPSKRIFIDLIPAYTYPRTNSYKEIRSVEVRLEYFFGDVE